MDKSKINQWLFLTEVGVAITGLTVSAYRYWKKKRKTDAVKMLSKKEKMILAYHEAGHAVVSRYLKTLKDFELEYVTIIPSVKENYDGYTYVDIPDESNITKSEWEEYLMYVLAGRAAEKIIFKEVATTSVQELKRATAIAARMVMWYG